eukprot:403375536
MLSKFSKNIASNYAQQKLTLAALLSGSRQAPALHQAAQTNSMIGNREQGQKRFVQMRMFSSSSADESQATMSQEAGATGSFKSIDYKSSPGGQYNSYRNNNQQSRPPRQFSKDGRVQNKNMTFDEQLGRMAELIRSEQPITMLDFVSNLKYLNRLISRLTVPDIKRIFQQEKAKLDMKALAGKFEAMIPETQPQDIPEFTNFLNVLRHHSEEGQINHKAKSALVARIQTMFTDEKFKADVEALSFDQVSKILSDMVHFGNVGFLGIQLQKQLDKAVTIENLTSIVRLLDSLMASNSGIAQLSRLVKSLETLLRQNENINLLSLSQVVRLLRIFSYSQQVNLQKHIILERLVKIIDSKIEELEEQDVLNLQQAYIYLPTEIPRSNILYNKLNQTVCEQAIENSADVSINFLQRYLSTFFDLSDARDNIDKNVTKQLVGILESKIEPSITKLHSSNIGNLTKILIRQQESSVLQQAVKTILVNYTSKVSFPEFKLAIIALRKLPTQELDELHIKLGDNLVNTKKQYAQGVAEAVMQIDLLRNRDPFVEGQKALIERFKANLKSLNRNDAVTLISQYTQMSTPSQQSTDIAKEIMDTVFGPENLSKVQTYAALDLLISLQTHSSVASKWLRSEHIQRLREQLKELPQNQIERYIKRVINHDEDMSLISFKNILEFLNSQSNLEKVPSFYKYALFQKITSSLRQDSLNSLAEKLKLPQIMNEFISHTDPKQVVPTSLFFDLLKMSSTYLPDIPNFFEKSFKNIVLNDQFYGQEQLLSVLSAQNLYYNSFDRKSAEKIHEFIKTQFNFQRLLENIKLNSDENQAGHLIRAANIIQIIQKSHPEDFKDNQNIITDERLSQVVDLALQKVERSLQVDRHISALNYICALSDYPDHLFTFYNNKQKQSQKESEDDTSAVKSPEERNIRHLVEKTFEKMNLRQAFPSFLQAKAGENQRTTKRVANLIFKEFDAKLGETQFKTAGPNHLTKILDKYTSHGWLIVNVYNNLLNAIGEKYDEFSAAQLISITNSFSRVGLKQEDVLSKNIDRIEEVISKDNNKSRLPFAKSVGQLFENLTHIQAQDLEAFTKLVSDEYVKTVCYGDKSFFDQARSEYLNHENILAGILMARLDEKDEKFKKLAEDIVEIINKKSYHSYNDSTLKMINLLTSENSPLSTKLTHENITKFKKAYESEQKRLAKYTASNLYRESQVVQGLKALGYNDIQAKVEVDGIFIPLYSKEHNTVIVCLDSTNLNYDRVSQNGDAVLLHRTIETMPSKPKIHVVNVFQLAKLTGDNAKELKVQYLRDEAHVPMVSTELNMNQEW